MSNLTILKEALEYAYEDDHTFTREEARQYHPVISRLNQVIQSMEDLK